MDFGKNLRIVSHVTEPKAPDGSASTTDSGSWGSRYAAVIGAQVRAHRKRRDISTQQLEEICRSLGHPISRSSIATLELGKRPTVSVADWLTMSAALEVPPMELLLPLGVTATVEALAGVEVPVDQALDWITLGWSPDGIPEITQDSRRLLTRVSRHASLVANLRTLRDDLAAIDAGTDDGDLTRDDVNEMIDQTWADLRVHRAHMKAAEQTPPDLPEFLQTLEAEDLAREARMDDTDRSRRGASDG